MKVLVTGGTGFVGCEIVKRLHLCGHSIRMIVRNPDDKRARELELRYNAEPRRGDILSDASLQSSLADVQAVIHLVGIISEVSESTFEKIHTGGTGNALAAAREAGVKRFVHMSALGTRPDATSRYHQTKWSAEELVRQSGLDFTIFRPSLIFGPGDKFVNLFANLIRVSPVIPVMASASAHFQPVAVELVAEAFVSSLNEPGSLDRTFDLCGPEKFTLVQMLDEILEVMGRKRVRVGVPFALAQAQAACLESIYKLLGKAPPLNRAQVLMLQEDNMGDPAPAEELFGLKQVRFADGIARYLKGDRET